MAKVNAAGWLDKWGRRLNSAGTDITNGVKAVTTAPGQSAAQAQALMLQRLTESVTSGLWAKNVAAVPLQSWQNSMIQKGIPRIGAGVTAAQSSKQQVITNLLAAVDSAAAKANALPKGTIDNSIARATEFMRAMNAAKGSIK